MRKILIAVCDADGSYAEKLAEWISLQKGERIKCVSFCSPECFLAYLNSQSLDIVLLGDEFWEDPQVCEEILKQGQGAGHAGEVLWMCLFDGECKRQIPEYISTLPAVDKYQPVSGLLREIFSVYQEWDDGAPGQPGTGKEVVGIYSPGHSVWQTTFALTFAQALARERKLLYVNLQECSGFKGWFHEEYEKDLLDVMYLCLEGEVNVAHCISSALYSMEGIDYIPPAEDGGCLGEISSADYLRFVELLSENSGYDMILLEFGMMIPGFFQLLGMCGKVYIVTDPGEMQAAPLQQFRRVVERQTETELAQKLIYLSLPVISNEVYPGEGKMQQWLWGAMGDFSRRLAGVSCGAD